MVRFLFRVLATLSLAGAMVMAVLDATRSVAASKLVVTPMLESWSAAFPDGVEATKAFVESRIGAFAWDSVALAILGLPGFVLLSVLAFVLYAVGHRYGPPKNYWA